MAFFLLIVAALLSSAEACAPAPTTTTPTPTTTPPTTVNGRRKKEVESVEVTVLTKMNYDPEMNDSHMQELSAMFTDYAETSGITFNEDLVDETVKNEDGKFAVVYTVLGADCGAVNNFARQAKSDANFITRIVVKCGAQPELVIN